MTGEGGSDTRVAIPEPCREAALRWKRGHHVFHLGLVTMNSLIDDSRRRAEGGDHAGLVVELGNLRTLYDAATANMLYASDFPRALYESFIRASMTPPFMSPGFSGTLNRDHTAMLQNLGRLSSTLSGLFGPDLTKWPSAIAEAWRAVLTAQARNRQHHGLVCRKFVDEGVSLLREFYLNRRENRSPAPFQEDAWSS